MRPVNPVDHVFFWPERRHQPMHVGGLQIFKLPPGAAPDFVAALARALREQVVIGAPFDQCLVYRRLRPFWAQATHLDRAHHIRYQALAQPGNMDALLALVAQLHSIPLQRSRPLWQCHIIDGITDNRFAIYYKLHHALMDGVGAMRLCQEALASEPQDHALPMFARTQSESAHPRQSPFSAVLQPAHALARQAATLPAVARGLYQNLADGRHHPAYTRLTQAPRCILNQPISGERHLATRACSLTRIRAVGKQLGATVNDLILVLCATALRNYLLALGALPAAPLVAMVPVALDGAGQGEHGNRLGMFCTSLATHMADPRRQLALIQRSSGYWKRRYQHMTADELRNFAVAMAAPAGLNLITGLAPRRQAFNVVISNMPGPKHALYLRGAELQDMYPAAIVVDGMALNITVLSYRDRLEFGALSCPRTLPGSEHLLDCLPQALAALEAAAQAERSAPEAASTASNNRPAATPNSSA